MSIDILVIVTHLVWECVIIMPFNLFTFFFDFFFWRVNALLNFLHSSSWLSLLCSMIMGYLLLLHCLPFSCKLWCHQLLCLYLAPLFNALTVCSYIVAIVTVKWHKYHFCGKWFWSIHTDHFVSYLWNHGILFRQYLLVPKSQFLPQIDV